MLGEFSEDTSEISEGFEGFGLLTSAADEQGRKGDVAPAPMVGGAAALSGILVMPSDIDGLEESNRVLGILPIYFSLMLGQRFSGGIGDAAEVG